MGMRMRAAMVMVRKSSESPSAWRGMVPLPQQAGQGNSSGSTAQDPSFPPRQEFLHQSHIPRAGGLQQLLVLAHGRGPRGPRSPRRAAWERSVDSCSPLRSSGSSSGREEENHLLLVSLDHCWVECGVEGGGEPGRAGASPPLPSAHPEPRPGERGGGQRAAPAPVSGRSGAGRGGGTATLTRATGKKGREVKGGTGEAARPRGAGPVAGETRPVRAQWLPGPRAPSSSPSPRPPRSAPLALRAFHCGAGLRVRTELPVRLPVGPARCGARGPGGRRWPRGAAGRWRRLALRNGKGGTGWAGERRGEERAGGAGCKGGLRRGGTAGVGALGDLPNGNVTPGGTWRSPLCRVDKKENPGPAEARHKVGLLANQADGTAKADPAAASQLVSVAKDKERSSVRSVSEPLSPFFGAPGEVTGSHV